jgi:hypothetical protein
MATAISEERDWKREYNELSIKYDTLLSQYINLLSSLDGLGFDLQANARSRLKLIQSNTNNPNIEKKRLDE